MEDITEALWGTWVSPSTVSDLNKKIYATIAAWRHRPIEDEHPYVYLDGIVLKRNWAGEVRNASLLIAIGVNDNGYREIIGICDPLARVALGQRRTRPSRRWFLLKRK
jgi:putative transposase